MSAVRSFRDRWAVVAGIVLAATALASAQTSKASEEPAPAALPHYFGQAAPASDRLSKFAPGVVSLPGSWEEKFTFTPDMREALFARHPQNDYSRPVLMQTFRADAQWSAPQPASFAGDNVVGFPLVGPQGQRLYVERVAGQIIQAEREDGGWSALTELTPQAEGKTGFGLAQLTNSGNFYDRYEHLIYVQRWNGESYQAPELLPAAINPAVEFYVARDESYLIFMPIDWGNPLHISFKVEGEWTLPISLRPYFKDWHGRGYGPYVSPDEKYFFIGLNGDIHWTTTDFIADLRKKRLAERAKSLQE